MTAAVMMFVLCLQPVISSSFLSSFGEGQHVIKTNRLDDNIATNTLHADKQSFYGQASKPGRVTMTSQATTGVSNWLQPI